VKQKGEELLDQKPFSSAPLPWYDGTLRHLSIISCDFSIFKSSESLQSVLFYLARNKIEEEWKMVSLVTVWPQRKNINVAPI
jgi:hypothetical protein